MQQSLPGRCAEGYENLHLATDNCPSLQSLKGVPAGKDACQAQCSLFLQTCFKLRGLCRYPVAEISRNSLLLLREQASFPHIEPLEVLPDLVQLMGLAESLHSLEARLDGKHLFLEGHIWHRQLYGSQFLGE